MKYPIKKSSLKTINIFSIPNIVRKPIPFLWTPKIKLFKLDGRLFTVGVLLVKYC